MSVNTDIFIRWFFGPFQFSLKGDFTFYPSFIRRFEEFKDMSTDTIDKKVIEQYLPDVRQFHNGKRLYQHFIEMLQENYLYATELFNFSKDHHYTKLLRYFLVETIDSRDVLPLLIPTKDIRDILDNIESTYYKNIIISVMIKWLIQTASLFLIHLYEYVPELEFVKPQCWVEFFDKDRTNGFLRDLKYNIIF